MKVFLLFLVLIYNSSGVAGIRYQAAYGQYGSPNIDPVASLDAGISGDFTRTISWSFVQSMTQQYYLVEGQDVFTVDDTQVSLLYNPKSRLKHWSLGTRFSLTLPVSDYSRRNQIYSKLSALATLYFKPSRKLHLGFGTSIGYQINEFDSEATGGQGQGSALPWYRYGFTQSGGWKIGEAFSLSYSLSQKEIFYHPIDDSDGREPENRTDQLFSASMSATYALSWISLSLGYSQSNALQVQGFQDYVLFDENRSIAFTEVRLYW